MKSEALRALLLDCLHGDAAHLDGAALARLDAQDWQGIEDLAIQTKALFALYQRLNRPDLRAWVPAARLERWRALLRAQTGRAMQVSAVLAEVLRACHAADLPVMVLKGAHLAEAVYESPLARPMCDIDLLFKPSDLRRATAVFKALGCPIPHDAASLLDLAPANNEYTLVHPRWGTLLDIHWSITHAAQEAMIDDAPFWERARSVRLADSPALVMAPEDLLVFLCFHASHHNRFIGAGLSPLLDVAQLCVREPMLDWEQVSRRAHQCGWQRGAYLVLLLTRDMLGAAIPERVFNALCAAPDKLAETRATALEMLFRESASAPGVNLNIQRLWTSTSLRRRAAILFGRLFPPRTELIRDFGLSSGQALPADAWLYLRRFGRLLSRHGAMAWGLWRRNPAHVAELARQHRLIDWLDAGAPDA